MAFLLCSIGLSSRGESKPYKGAEYRTIQSFHFGRFEVRWKSAPGSGLLSSFFTFHDSFNPIAEWNEIDFENLGRYSNQTQYNVITPGQVQHVRADTLPFNPHQAFHEYAIEWTPDYVAWFVDGYETHRQTGPHIQQLIHGQKNMMNIWISDNTSWVGPFNPAILPVYAYYDWVKYYSYTPETSSHFTLQWVDSLEAWDASRWQKASHTWNGNLVDFTPENVVFRDGYLILCLTLPGALGYNGGPVIDQDVDPPYMVWARSYPNKLFLFFSEPVDSVSAQNLNNYILPGFSVTGAQLLNDGRTVRLTVPGIDLNLTLNLLAKDIADLASPPNVMSLSSIKVIPPLPVPFQVNVGGPAHNDYLPDQIYDYWKEYGATGGTEVTQPATVSISGTSDPEIFRSERRGLTFYQVRLDPGSYQVTLQFAETEHQAAGLRVFDVQAEGQWVLQDLDIFAQVGAFTALEKTVGPIAVPDGLLDLYFAPQVGQPVLSGLKIAPATPTGIEPGGKTPIPESFQLKAFPNPFNPSTQIAYRLPGAGQVRLEVYSALGQRVAVLASGNRAAGNYQIRWQPQSLPAGIYFLQLRVDGKPVKTFKLVYLR